MIVRTAVAQIPVSWNVRENLAEIARVVKACAGDDLVVLPEGALSGYGTDLSPLADLDPSELDRAMTELAELAVRGAVHVVCGSLTFDAGRWWNAAILFDPEGGRSFYRKINLAMNERGVLAAGSELPVHRLALPGGAVDVGMQICREIRFPEQWGYMARSGAGVFAYLTNAANPDEPSGVWRSHLISRAAENQRWVLAANVADPISHCPTMIVSPRGEVLSEVAGGEPAVLRAAIDTDSTSEWYLGQRRRDVIEMHYLS
ncbi:carbon-nitrogen hydrolase family protein [Streptosporangium sandarakinum]|uniref:carbon-nitrogen hydrolase family protein n=1 Tax=Streptosporangium sandarakinum TaxID=1260955 RepID=UPI003433503D